MSKIDTNAILGNQFAPKYAQIFVKIGIAANVQIW